MRHHALVLSPLLLLGCATTRTSDLIVSDTTAVRAGQPIAEALPAAPVAELDSRSAAPSLLATEAEAPAESISSSLAAAAEDDMMGLHGDRFTIKGGYYGASEDELDDGYIVNVSWMHYTSKLFAIELEVGYLDADGSDGGVDVDVWSVPIMLNGRLNAPIWIFDAYAGAGVGTFYYDAEVESGGASADDDGFLWAVNGFIGGSINIADALALGLEAKYYVTDDVDDADAGLDAYAIMLTLGWTR